MTNATIVSVVNTPSEEIVKKSNNNDFVGDNNFQGTTNFGSTTNYAEFSNTGTLTLSGSATTWDDLLVPLTSTKKGTNDLPHFDETNLGYLFPNGDTSEILYIIVQMPHRWKEGSVIFPHIHYKRTSAGKPTFKISYSWNSTGSAVSSPSTVLELGTEVFPYVSGNIHQINTNSAGIDGTGKTISSILLIKLYRDDSVVAGDVLAYQFDIHYEIDSLGSNTEYSK